MQWHDDPGYDTLFGQAFGVPGQGSEDRRELLDGLERALLPNGQVDTQGFVVEGMGFTPSGAAGHQTDFCLISSNSRLIA